MAAGDMLRDLVHALGFLSRVPLPGRYFEGYDGSLKRASGTFAVAGALIALPPSILFGLCLHFDVSPNLAALLALGLQTGLTGGLHEDGLADCADGFGGGRTRDRILEIMKDSRLGAYGGIALVFSFMFRMEALAVLGVAAGPTAAAMVMIAVNAASRAALVWHWSDLPPAKSAGVAAGAGQPAGLSTIVAIASGVAIYVLLIGTSLGSLPCLAGAVCLAAAMLGFRRLTRGKIQGHTGDTLGASEQVAEMAIFVALALVA